MSLDDNSFSDADSDQFIQPQSETRSGAQVPSWGAKRCPTCYTVVLENQTVCAECGTHLIPRVTRVRCLHCGKHATTDHVICPSCGRNLQAAPSRLLTIGVPGLLVAALAVVLIARGMPAFLQENGNLPLLPNFVITPASSDSEPTVRLARESLAPAVVQSGPDQPDEPSSSDASPAVVTDPTPTPEESGAAADGSQAGAMAADTAVPPAGTPAITATSVEEEPTAIVAAVENTATPPPPFPQLPTVTETATATPMVTPTPTPSPTPAWMTYTIREGDTIDAIANRFGISQDELLRANNLTARDATRLQIEEEIVLPGLLQVTPTPTPTEVATEAPTATPAG